VQKPEKVNYSRLCDAMALVFKYFILHALLTASFLVLPLKIEEMTGLTSFTTWRFYLPV